MNKETLSDKTFENDETFGKVVPVQDVKQFIKELKEEVNETKIFGENRRIMIEIIDKLAGKSLVEK